MEKKLYRSSDSKLCGVCGGLAEYFDLDPVIVRIAYAAGTFLFAGLPGIILYIIMALIIPQK